MTLAELEYTLPNGFHDAEVSQIDMDYSRRLLALHIAAWVGSMDDPKEHREAYRNGELEISGLIFFIPESPDPKYPYQISTKLTIDSVKPGDGVNSELLKSLPAGSFVHTFWVNEWNACMHVAGLNAEIVWKGETIYRTTREHFLPGETIEL